MIATEMTRVFPGLNSTATALPAPLAHAVSLELSRWADNRLMARLWNRDAGLWTGKDEARWMGWLDIPERMRQMLPILSSFREEAKAFRHVLLLGMGGSSLGPEVLARTFDVISGWPRLHVLDSTDPQQIRTMEGGIDLAQTLVIVSSKSGNTLEPNILKTYFHERLVAAVGAEEASRRFVAITDPGTALDKMAKQEGFRRLFLGDAEIGGRYSVLSPFGLVPAAAMGIDLTRFLDETERMEKACGAEAPAASNPGLILGAVLGIAAKHKHDKATILATPAVESFAAWAEQLIAESTGKTGLGIIPLDGLPVGATEDYGNDRLFIHLSLAGEQDPQEAALDALAAAGHPVVRIRLHDRYAIAQEFFRWEIATAVAGSIIGINPFDQPDVEASKNATRALTAAYERDGSLPVETPFFEDEGVALYADAVNRDALLAAAPQQTLDAFLKAHFDRLRTGDYAALLAYIERDAANEAAVAAMRLPLRAAKKIAVCTGFGPRFLHSTGQAYKGGPNTGVFLQITADDAQDLSVPGHRYSFGVVKAAQARGDFDVLNERGRRALRVHLRGDLAAGLDRLKRAVGAALVRA